MITEGQRIAMQWYGLPPVAWGWLVAAVAAGLALAAWKVKLPVWLAADPDVAEPDARWGRRWVWAAVAFALALHAQGFAGHFNIFDDPRQIWADKVISSATPENLRLVLFGNYKGTNQELMYLSMMGNYALAGKYYWVWYLFNWLMLVPLGLLVARLGRQLTGSRLAGALAAAFIACTPLISEMLCWMSARSHLYGLLLTLASASAWLEYRSTVGRRRWGWYALAVLSFVGSQLGKPIYLFFVAWLVLFDVRERRRDWLVLVADKLPFVGAAAWFVHRIMVAGAGKRLIKPTPLGGDYWHTLLQDANQLVEYGRTLFVPSQTGMLPPYNEATGLLGVSGTPMVLAAGFAPLASLLVLASVLAVALALWRRFGWGLPLWWLAAAVVTFGTVMNIPNRGPAAVFEYRYTLSAQAVTAVLLGDVGARLLRSRLVRSQRWRHLPAAVVFAWMAWGALATWQNTAAWHDSVAYWTRNAEMYPHSQFAHYYAGKAWQHANSNHAALHHLLLSERYKEREDVMLYKRIGDNAYWIGDFERAREYWPKYFSVKRKDVDDKYRERFAEVGLDEDVATGRKPTPMGSDVEPPLDESE